MHSLWDKNWINFLINWDKNRSKHELTNPENSAYQCNRNFINLNRSLHNNELINKIHIMKLKTLSCILADLFWYVTGMVFSKGEIHTKMEFMELHAPFLLARTSPTIFKSKTKLEAFSISHLLLSTRQLVALVPSKSSAGQGFQFPSQNQRLISPFLLEIGTRLIIR